MLTLTDTTGYRPAVIQGVSNLDEAPRLGMDDTVRLVDLDDLK